MPELSVAARYLDTLLDNVELGDVVPIIGPELVTADGAGDAVPLERYLAPALAGPLGVRPEDLPSDPTLADVVTAYLTQRDTALADIPPKLYRVLGAARLAPPDALRKLARIRPLRLFLTTTFDSLLRDAINQVRFGGAPGALECAHAPNDVQDLPVGWSLEGSGPPLVYHLFGVASPRRTFVLTEEDVLEHMRSLQSEAVTRTRLFDEVNRRHLLFLGCRFPDWLARFVLRTTRRDPLSASRTQLTVVADGAARSDRQLEVFLEQFSVRTFVFPGTGAEFVDAMYARWIERHPEDAVDAPAAAPAPAPPPATQMPTAAPVAPVAAPAVPPVALMPAPLVTAAAMRSDPAGGAATPASSAPPGPPAAGPDDATAVPMRFGSVFISYSSDDHEAAERLCRALSDVDVWLDRERLKDGANWDTQIRRNIDDCSLFVPILSRSSANRYSGYYRKEWGWAVDRFHTIDPRWVFLLPVVIDDLPYKDHGIPDEFWTRQAARIPGGAAPPEFASRVRDLVKEFKKANQPR